MSPREPSRALRPTEAELAILGVLWQQGEATVREVYDELYRDEGAGYTTALKLLQVMHAKGLVARNEGQRAHVYRPLISKKAAQRTLMGDLVRRVFDGRPGELVLSALGGARSPSAAELKKIRDLLDDLERKHVRA